MPIGELAVEAVGGVFRLIGYVLVEILFEVLIKGVGYFLCRPFNKDVDPDGAAVVLVGLICWLVIGFFGYHVVAYLAEQLAIDRCLDAGGVYDYEVGECITDPDSE